MISPKRLLQRWLGIEAIATRVANIELGRSSGFTTISYKGVPVDIDDNLLYQAIKLRDDEAPVVNTDTSIKPYRAPKGEGSVIIKGYEN